MPIFVTKLTSKEKNLTNAYVSDWLKKVEINEHDVVIIYYSGHGFCTIGRKTTIPFGDLPPYKKRREAGLIFVSLLSF